MEQTIAEEQARLARLPLLQTEIEEAREMLEMAQEAGLMELAERLSRQVTRLEDLYQRDQESTARRIARVKALRASL